MTREGCPQPQVFIRDCTQASAFFEEGGAVLARIVPSLGKPETLGLVHPKIHSKPKVNLFP